MKLLTIRFSHYCERARWVLDYYEEPYDEKTAPPMAHVSLVRWHVGRTGGKRDNVSSSHSVPILIVDQDTILRDSLDICRYIDEKHGGALFKHGDAALEWCKEFHDQLGPNSRYLAYAALLPNPSMFMDTTYKNFGWIIGVGFWFGQSYFSQKLASVLNITEEKTKAALEETRKVFDKVEKLLEDGRAFLLGPEISIADITFASLAAPALVVSPSEGYGAWVPSVDDERIPESSRVTFQEFRERPAGKHVLKLFREHRGKRVTPLYPLVN